MQILFVATGLPWPPTSGGSIRALSQLRALSALPQVDRILLLSMSEDEDRDLRLDALVRELPKVEAPPPVFHPIHLFRHPRYLPRVAWLRIARGAPYVAGKWESRGMRESLERELGDFRFDVVWLESLGSAWYLPLIRRSRPDVRVVLDGFNVESDLWAQYASRKRGPIKLVAEAEWRAARRFERDALRAVDSVAAISEDDARGYRELAGVDAVYVPQIVSFKRRTARASQPPRLCYVGTLSWHPNARGLDWFCAEVWPRVRERLPDATLDIVGSGLLTDASGEAIVPPTWGGPGIRTLGFVSDLGPIYARSVAMVAPTLGGSGVRVKLLEAFRNGAPVITTPDGARGLSIESGREAFVESDPARFAERVVEVATSDAQQARLRDAGYEYLERHHGLDVALRSMRSVLGLDAPVSAESPDALCISDRRSWESLRSR